MFKYCSKVKHCSETHTHLITQKKLIIFTGMSLLSNVKVIPKERGTFIDCCGIIYIVNRAECD